MNGDYLKGMEQAYSLIEQANDLMIHLWLKDTLFTWKWWLGVVMSTVPWIIWFIFRRQESKDRLLLAGFFVMLIASWFDVLGVLFGLWSYYHNVVPFSPAFVPWDFTLLPVMTMFFLQIKPRISPWLKAIVLSGISSFMAEPLFVYIGLYNPKHWKFIYSFPILAVIYLMAHWLSRRVAFKELDKQ